MTVRELRNRLLDFNQDEEILLDMSTGDEVFCFSRIHDVIHTDDDSLGDGFLFITCYDYDVAVENKLADRN